MGLESAGVRRPPRRSSGAIDYLLADGSEGELEDASVPDCIAACPLPNCTGFKYKPLERKCFLRSYISLGECAAAEDQDTWVNTNSPVSGWQRNANLNCMEGNGAVDFLLPDGSEGELEAATLVECMAACALSAGCVGFKYKPFDGNKCFLRSYISLGECAASEGQDTWVNTNSPVPGWERNANLNCMEGCAARCPPGTAAPVG